MTSILSAYEKDSAGKNEKPKTIFMSTKTISSDIILVVYQKKRRSYDIFSMKVALYILYFVFGAFC